jgi:hypothetical protein
LNDIFGGEARSFFSAYGWLLPVRHADRKLQNDGKHESDSNMKAFHCHRSERFEAYHNDLRLDYLRR